ncbi:OadG family protein [Idiomarina sp.]|uniref:OadG family protein n=1 Tax=Idiomarina sp. TaxID=1874361 RepID=UPI0025C518FF|nr:OadG family transporter subunit [Idiomarina sp.]MEC7642836.1 OadG family transporter subunit [Pseudomonadota bacterium]MEC9318586.1 OadG family transporter subunit [Pseudomonadota bacterium]
MSELFISAAEIMAVGMTSVITFLLLLIFVMTLMAKYLPKGASHEPTPRSARKQSKAGNQPSDDTVAAISAAVHAYRTQRKK